MIRREFRLGTDTWTAGDFTFRVFSPMSTLPDPEKTATSAVKSAVVPEVWAEMTVDNRGCKRERTAFFAWQGSDPYSHMRWMNAESGYAFSGIGQGTRTAIVSRDPNLKVGTFFNLEDMLRPEHADNIRFGIGPLGGIRAMVPDRKRKTFSFTLCFFHGGIVTAGLPASYYYTRFFPQIEAVADWALAYAPEARRVALAADRVLDKATHLSDAQRFQLAHAICSYYGSTDLLDHAGRPLWVVNEGEYRMMNTFDLTVGHLFFELRQNPWVVRCGTRSTCFSIATPTRTRFRRPVRHAPRAVAEGVKSEAIEPLAKSLHGVCKREVHCRLSIIHEEFVFTGKRFLEPGRPHPGVSIPYLKPGCSGRGEGAPAPSKGTRPKGR